MQRKHAEKNGEDKHDIFHKPNINLDNMSLKNYSETITSVEINELSPYVEIIWKDRRMVLKKSSMCWLLREEPYKLSSDRLRRVMNPVRPIKTKK